MEVVVQSPPRSPTLEDFEFSGTMSSPYLSAPSSPKRLGEYYLSAPTSPSRISQLYSEFEYFSATIDDSGSSSRTHFEAANNNYDDDDDDDDGFAFYVSHESDKPSRSAEELFDGGKIKPLEPEGNESFTTHHIAEEGNKVLKAFSPKMKKNESQETQHGRGRDRTPASVLTSSNSGRRVTRSHSPYRTSQYTWEEEQQQHHYHPQQQHHYHPQQQPLSNKEGSTLTSSSNSSKGSSRRWRLRDLLLFRSASEGRGSTKDPFKTLLYNKKHEEVHKTSSFRSSDYSSRRKGHVSAHELHYATKRAESEDMKKRTFLPYKPGILGRLAGFGL